MQLAQRLQPADQKMSPSIYAALVDSLFQNPAPMFAGALCAALAAFLTAFKTGQQWLWVCALALMIVGGLRAIDMQSYSRRPKGDNAPTMAHWEVRYQIGAMLYAITLGLWCTVCILTTDDAIAHMICTTVITGYIAAGAGRTYGRPWIFQLQILFACGTLCIALAMHGGGYYLALALLNVLFFVGLKNITTSLQQIFVRALVARESESALANLFDTALNNMPHGLCMFDADGRLAIVNRRFSEMMGVDLKLDLGANRLLVPDIIAECVKAGSIESSSAPRVISGIKASEIADITTLDSREADPRALSWTIQPMPDGGTVVLVEDITERRSAAARITHMASYDDLTALPNRVSFRNEIERLLALPQQESHRSALLFIDLDQFKQVNDTLGHPCGDQLLCLVANRLREMLRPEDYVARFGGDEFVIFQQDISSGEEAEALARRVVERLSERYRIDNHLVEIGASVGIALTSPGITADNLLKNADMALYRAKADGRGRSWFFREEMALTVEARRILELDLRKALAEEEFELFYQPLINLKSGRISTCEALLRWNHPTRGRVSPIDIIPVAEDMGLIIDLGRWIMRKACVECAMWPEAVSVAVNFSPQQFQHRDIVNEVKAALQESGLAAHRLEIEITESSLLRNTQATQNVLSQLRAVGVRISLDDFGTGYSSLSYLHSLPLQKVKIDRSFLQGIDTERPLMLLRGVARLSADLGMSVVVEGIETVEQLELVSAEGTVTEAQGYLFSRPVPAMRIRHLLDASHGRRSAGDTASRSIA